MMKTGRKIWINDEISSTIDVQACPFENIAFLFGFDRHFATKDGVDDVGGIDILMMRISVLFVMLSSWLRLLGMLVAFAV